MCYSHCRNGVSNSGIKPPLQTQNSRIYSKCPKTFSAQFVGPSPKVFCFFWKTVLSLVSTSLVGHSRIIINNNSVMFWYFCAALKTESLFSLVSTCIQTLILVHTPMNDFQYQRHSLWLIKCCNKNCTFKGTTFVFLFDHATNNKVPVIAWKVKKNNSQSNWLTILITFLPLTPLSKCGKN